MVIKKKLNILYIKFWRNNIFLNLSSINGFLLYKCSMGYIKSEQEKNVTWALTYLIKSMGTKLNIFDCLHINLILDGILNKSRLALLFSALAHAKFKINYLKILDKIPHNGCRMKTKRTKLSKRFYLS